MANVPIVTDVTKAELDVLVSANLLNEGLQYKVTDNNWLIVATSTNTYIYNESIPYKKWIGTIMPDGIGGLTTNALDNSIGNIVWVQDTPGAYIGTLLNAFPEDKTYIATPYPILDLNVSRDGEFGVLIRGNNDCVTLNVSTPNTLPYGDWAYPIYIEIRVYV